jgi:hypothetical protein
MGDTLKRSPDEIPAIYAADLEKLHKQCRRILDLKMVPYFIQAQLARGDYCSVEDLADRWDTPEVARRESPKQLKYEPGDNNYDDASSSLAAMRLYQAVKMAKSYTPGSPGHTGGPAGASGPDIDPLCDRQQLESQFTLSFGFKPQLIDQGSDSLLKRQFRSCQRGEIGYLHVKQIVSFLPDSDERPQKRQRKSVISGVLVEEEEEERQHPTTLKQLEHAHKVFTITLLMCTVAFPQFPKFDVTYSDLEDFYQWLHGPAIAARTPAPSVQVLSRAERMAWREIAQKMHLGKSLKTSLIEVKNDLLFWQREVYEKISFRPPTSTSGLDYRGGKGQRSDFSYNRHFRGGKDKGKGSKGKPGKGKKGRGKHDGKKGERPKWPSNWASKNPKGIDFCSAYHLRGNCTGQCNKSHNCPVYRKDGWVCNAPPDKHSPQSCPNA